MTASPAERQAEKQLIKSRVRLDELVAELTGCEFEQRGQGSLWACCPFHSEETASFHIRPQIGVYYCFGCNVKGDVFSFVQGMRGCGFREALEFLADRAGVTLGSLTPDEVRRQGEVRRLRDALSTAGQLFVASLASPEGRQGREYLLGRGFTPQTLERFDVGFVPTDFFTRLRQAGLSNQDVERAGFTRAFAGRVSFGIRDAHGGLVGFGARTLDADGGPKYVNTRETDAFNKRRLLYGFDKAARQLGRSRRLVVMEGYTDVMMAHQCGLDEAVASMGTSLTTDHLNSLKGRVPNLVLVFDGDPAGQSAAERAVRLALAEGNECRILSLPDGADPCDWFSGRTREDFDALLEQAAVSTATFLCRRTLDAIEMGQPGRLEQAAREVFEATRTITDPVRRDGLTAEISRACGVDRNLLVRASQAAPAPARTSGPRQRPGKVNALTRSQYVAVGGLATVPGCRAELEELVGDEVIADTNALRLHELGRMLDGDPIDPIEWIDMVNEREPALASLLQRLLFPPPDVVLPSYVDAVEHLRERRRETDERGARRAALSQPDIHSDEAALRALDESLRARTRTADPDSQRTPRASSPGTDAATSPG